MIEASGPQQETMATNPRKNPEKFEKTVSYGHESRTTDSRLTGDESLLEVPNPSGRERDSTPNDDSRRKENRRSAGVLHEHVRRDLHEDVADVENLYSNAGQCRRSMEGKASEDAKLCRARSQNRSSRKLLASPPTKIKEQTYREECWVLLSLQLEIVLETMVFRS
jgi:hypothetical protein